MEGRSVTSGARAGVQTVRPRAAASLERLRPSDQPEYPDEPVRLRLLGGFDLRVGDQIVTLPLNVRRLIALLAVRERPQTRTRRRVHPVDGHDAEPCDGESA